MKCCSYRAYSSGKVMISILGLDILRGMLFSARFFVKTRPEI